MTKMLVQSLEGQVFVTGPYEQKREGRVAYLPGRRHETLVDAQSFFTYRNMDLYGFERIFAVMRNPYDLELSRYAYLRKDLPQDRGPAQKIALEHDYKEYLKRAPFFGMNPPRLNLYFSLNGTLPDNLTVLKFENLNADIETYMSPYLSEGYKLPFENVSKHKKYQDVYDAETEQLVFDRNRWFFEKGFYARESF
ncbi:hypothetical protein [Gilvimarinus chinensis]|uniref:hypothetical protein n=1 Tax=Gilvimarinus chinensis TaxID=396005 RepID=UPI0005916A60|nr:hypothetical protein [Gilvimarinus chinensis]